MEQLQSLIAFIGRPKLKRDTFLMKFSLETGGFVIAFGFLVFYILAIVGLVLALFTRYDEVSPELKAIGIQPIFAFFVIELQFVLITISCFYCIKGIQAQNQSMIIPLMVALGFLSYGCFLLILTLSLKGLLIGPIFLVIHGYSFSVIYSLFAKFSDPMGLPK